MVTGPALAGAAYVRVHELELGLTIDKVHVGPLKLPPTPPSLQETIPVGTLVVPALRSFTDTVKVTLFPAFTDDGFGDMLAPVVRRLTVSEDAPELIECAESPL